MATPNLESFFAEVSDPLSDTEKAQLQLLISARNQTLSRLRREKRITLLKKAKSKLCYIARLATELLTEIFGFYALSSGNQDPIILRQICRRWRAVTGDSPRLFRHLPLELPCFNPKGGSYSIARHTAQLKLATSRFPVTLRISCSDRPHASDELKALTHLFAGVIGTLHLELCDTTIVQNLFPTTTKSSTPLLTLLIEGSDNGPESRDARILDPRGMNLPCTDLTKLTITYNIEMTLAWGLVSGCPALKDFFIYIVSDSPSADTVGPLVLRPQTLHNLTTASLFFQDRVVPYSQFLSALTAPALRCLRVHAEYNTTGSEGFLALKNHSAFDLTCAHLGLVHFDPGHMERFVRDMPSLALLGLDVYSIPDLSAVTRTLLIPNGQDPAEARVGPKLHTLKIRAFGSELDAVGCLGRAIDILDSRKSTLKTATLEFGCVNESHRADDAGLKARVDALIEGGMVITISRE